MPPKVDHLASSEHRKDELSVACWQRSASESEELHKGVRIEFKAAASAAAFSCEQRKRSFPEAA